MLHDTEKDFIKRHIGTSEEEQLKMLKVLGYSSLDELISKTVPEKILFKEDLEIGEPNSEYEALRKLKIISRKNTIFSNFIGMGYYGTYTPNVIIRNTIVKDNVSILDGCVIGKKGFGFFPNKDKNIRYPHIGIVIINENCEIGCGSTIDRGSLSNTIIGKNTYLDNQVHIAHNNKIGDNCIIAGQVGFAGSSTLGNNVMIGGQAGVSGHLKVGNNVQIGGGSGVINDIPDNTKVMGYPAKNLREFIKENR